MIILFYTLTILFFWMEIYYVYNKANLDTIVKNRDIEQTSMKDILYYASRLSYYAWMVIGMWSSQSDLFIFLTVFATAESFLKLGTFSGVKKPFNKLLYTILLLYNIM